MNVNVLGTIHAINAFLPLLKASSATRTVRVVALTSALADLDSTLVTGFAGQPVYSISKAAVNMVIAKYAVRLREENFVFLAISPGLVNTMTSLRAFSSLLHREGLCLMILCGSGRGVSARGTEYDRPAETGCATVERIPKLARR